MPFEIFYLKTIQNATNNSELIQTRDSIDNGIKIWYENEKVWMKNFTKFNIFWVRPLFSNESMIETSEPLSTSLIYDYKFVEAKVNENVRLKFFDPHVVNISFKKSWGGKNLKRKSIDQCPCWISLSVNVEYIMMARQQSILTTSSDKNCMFM